jgi:uncharacterized integral membrane protein (TIGR00698 family)
MPLQSIFRIIPGVSLCLMVTAASAVLGTAEARLFGREWLEPLVLAILLGTAIRTLLAPAAGFDAGIRFSAKFLLELAVVLLGFSVSGATILGAGPGLLAGIAGTVVAGILCSYFIGRALGLRPRMAVLVACGNSICGNSAIAAVAPVIGAEGEDVAAAIGFTAVLGVLVVLGLPPLVSALGLSAAQSGIFAGLTVYAVPQVLAATAPVGAAAVQMGTLVKLLRVLMLGPVVLALSVLGSRLREGADAPRPQNTAGARAAPGVRAAMQHLVPWFILVFLAACGLRSAGWVPAALLPPIASAATALTTVSMAALGLGVDVRSVAGAGGRVTASVVLSLAVLAGISLALIAALRGAM